MIFARTVRSSSTKPSKRPSRPPTRPTGCGDIYPRLNAPDLRELPEETRAELEIVLVDPMDEVLARALHPQQEALAVPPG
jgi:hypothetical protein